MPLPNEQLRELNPAPGVTIDAGRGPVAELLEAAAGAPPLTRALPDIAATLADATSMGRATVLLYDRRGNLVAGTSRTANGGLDAQLWAAFRLLHESMPAVDAGRRGVAPVVFLQPENAVALGPADWVARFEARTVVVAPIRSRRCTIGVVVLDDPARGAFDEAHLEGLNVATSGAAAVLELLEAVEHERKARARTEQVIETAAATARSMTAAAACRHRVDIDPLSPPEF